MGRKRTLTDIEKIIAENSKNRPYKNGKFYPDPTPVELPVGYERQPSMMDLIRAEIHRAGLDAAKEGWESLEEANDFDVEEDNFLTSPYEFSEDENEVPELVLKSREEEAAKEAEKEKAPNPSGSEGAKDDVSSSAQAPEAQNDSTTTLSVS